MSVGKALQSACKTESKSDTGGLAFGAFKAEPRGDKLVIAHTDARYNCAAKLDLKVTVNGHTIRVEEILLNPTETARCMCNFDISAEVSGLPKGHYDLELIDAEGKSAAKTTALVGEQVPAVGATYQSACKAETKSDSFGAGLKTEQKDGEVIVRHEDARYNCADKLRMDAELSGDTITVREVVTSTEKALCMCNYDLSVSLKGLKGGAYKLKVVDADGKEIGQTTVTLP